MVGMGQEWVLREYFRVTHVDILVLELDIRLNLRLRAGL